MSCRLPQPGLQQPSVLASYLSMNLEVNVYITLTINVSDSYELNTIR